MKTQLFYFDGTKRSKKGTLRGLVVTIILLVVNSIMYKIYKKHFNFNIIYVLIMTILIASAISVQNPYNLNEALVYGGLVGGVVFGSINSVLLMTKHIQWSKKNAILSILVGISSTVLSSYVLYSVPQLNFI